MKVTQKGFIFYEKHAWETKGEFIFLSYKPVKDTCCTYVKDHTITFDVPDEFDSAPGQIAAFKETEKELRAQFAVRLMEIQDSISKLTCINMDVQS